MPDEYTPTTDEVRERFALVEIVAWNDDTRRNERQRRVAEKLLKRFDRWLASHDAEVARDAGERSWDEGYIAASAEANDGGCVDFTEDADNPYRADRLAATEAPTSAPSRPCAPRGDENGSGVGSYTSVLRSDAQNGEGA